MLAREPIHAPNSPPKERQVTIASAQPTLLDLFVSARADLPEASGVRAFADSEADEYVGLIHQTDRWLAQGPRGTGAFVREQAYAPTTLVRLHRARREQVNREEHQIEVLRADETGRVWLPREIAAAPVIQAIQRAREIWLLGHVRINIDTVPRAGVFLSLEAVIDDQHPEEVGRARVRELLHAMGVADQALVPKTYLELILDRAAQTQTQETTAELEAIRANNRAAVEERLDRLRAMGSDRVDPGDGA